ncbi:MAG: hypothetical protein ACLT29_05085 [Ruminococcus callidus]
MSEAQVLETLDRWMVNLEECEINVDVVRSRNSWQKYNVIALSENDGKLQLAMSDPRTLCRRYRRSWICRWRCC